MQVVIVWITMHNFFRAAALVKDVELQNTTPHVFECLEAFQCMWYLTMLEPKWWGYDAEHASIYKVILKGINFCLGALLALVQFVTSCSFPMRMRLWRRLYECTAQPHLQHARQQRTFTCWESSFPGVIKRNNTAVIKHDLQTSDVARHKFATKPDQSGVCRLSAIAMRQSNHANKSNSRPSALCWWLCQAIINVSDWLSCWWSLSVFLYGLQLFCFVDSGPLRHNGSGNAAGFWHVMNACVWCSRKRLAGRTSQTYWWLHMLDSDCASFCSQR